MTRKFTEDDVADMLSNPVYTGIGPYPQIVEEQQWIAAATIRIKEVCAEAFLARMLRVLRSAMAGTRLGD